MTEPLDWRPMSELPDEWPEGATCCVLSDCTSDEPDTYVNIRERANVQNWINKNIATGCLHFAFFYPPQTEELQ